MRTDQRQFYIRFEPSPESRDLLRAHQEHLARIFDDLTLHPRFIGTDNLHWTALFLDSPRRWNQCLRALGVAREISVDDLLQLMTGNDDQLTKMAAANFGSLTARPVTYDVFFTNGTNAVFVLHVRRTELATGSLLAYVRRTLASHHPIIFSHGALRVVGTRETLPAHA